MKRVLGSIGVAVLIVADAAAAQQVAIDWSRTPVTGSVVRPGEGPDGASALELRAQKSGASFHLVTIEHPPITAAAFAVVGDVRYEGVEGQGYLEMWTVLPDGQRFFSRTLEPAGPLAAFHGDAKWRRFALPFRLGDSGPTPSRLEINVALPGAGTVWIGPLRLEQSAGGWWSERSGALYGAMLGSALGALGAIIGVLGGRGRARGLVFALLTGMIVAGGCAVLLGGAAAFTAQPRHVWYPLVMLGGLTAVVALGVRPALRRRFAADELRRIQAMDAGRPVRHGAVGM